MTLPGLGVPAFLREYRSPGVNHYNSIIQRVPFSKPRASEVTIKVHTVTFHYNTVISLSSKGRCPGQKYNVVPCSDGADEIVAAGEDVKGWKIGDRVCPNFALDHIHGDVTEVITGKNTGLGG